MDIAERHGGWPYPEKHLGRVSRSERHGHPVGTQLSNHPRRACCRHRSIPADRGQSLRSAEANSRYGTELPACCDYSLCLRRTLPRDLLSRRRKSW